MPKKKRKLSLNEAALALTRIAERHISKFPHNEQESRVAAFSRIGFKKTCQNRPKSSKTGRTPASRTVATFLDNYTYYN